jgi:hypothetical protein
MLKLISGDIGEERNWNEYRNLFLDNSKKLALITSKTGDKKLYSFQLEEFIEKIGPNYAKDGFEEYAIGLKVQEFNGIANVFQSFYCRNLRGTYENRGVNAYQVVYKEDRWWIAQVLYTNETSESPIPQELLFVK